MEPAPVQQIPRGQTLIRSAHRARDQRTPPEEGAIFDRVRLAAHGDRQVVVRDRHKTELTRLRTRYGDTEDSKPARGKRGKGAKGKAAPNVEAK